MFRKLFSLIGLLLVGYVAIAQNYPPKSTTLVTDYTNTLSATDKQQLENKLVAFDDSTSTQIAIVIIKSVGDYDINEYGAGLGRNWGIGQKGKNNGILILVAIDDRKLTIQTGYGVEGALPDVIAQQIRLNDINPRFRQGDYYGGLNAATDDIIRYTKGEYKAPKNDGNNTTTNNAHGDNNSGASIAILILVVIVMLWVIFRNRGGGGGQVIGSRGGASPFWWFVAGSMWGNGGGGDGWGGFSGGGNDSGGGGGDFGGFGGGDFGGGGSGGSW